MATVFEHKRNFVGDPKRQPRRPLTANAKPNQPHGKQPVEHKERQDATVVGEDQPPQGSGPAGRREPVCKGGEPADDETLGNRQCQGTEPYPGSRISGSNGFILPTVVGARPAAAG